MKEILDSEILSDEDLEKVSGGGERQTTGDSEFLNKLGYTHDTYYPLNSDGLTGLNKQAIERAWAWTGIICKVDTSVWFDNKYFLKGQEISRKDAFRHVMKERGWNQIAIDCFDFDRYAGSFW